MGETRCHVALRANPKVYQDFTIKVINEASNQVSITGAERIAMGGFAEYTIPVGNYSYSSLNNLFEIDKIEGDRLIIKALSMGKDKLVLEENESIIFEKTIEIVSPWMEV